MKTSQISQTLTILTLYNAKLFIDNPYSHSLKYLLTLPSIFKIIVGGIKYFSYSTIGKQSLGVELKPVFIACERQLYWDHIVISSYKKTTYIHESISIRFRTDDDLRRYPIFLRSFSGESFRSKNWWNSRPGFKSYGLCLDASWLSNCLLGEIFLWK